MYQGKLAFAIKVNGKVLREQAETVFIPFGSEYSLLIKNLNNRRACVKITIDGREAVADGLIVNANSTVELERFVEAGQFEKGHRFKFIERSAAVEEHRGVGVEDGLIRVEFEYEREREVYTTTTWTKMGGTTYGGDHLLRSRSLSGEVKTSSGIVGQAYNASSISGNMGSLGGSASLGAQEPIAQFSAQTGPTMDWAEQEMSRSVNDAGITVEGSVSGQRFVSTYFTGDGQSHVMVVKILGELGQKQVVKPVTVRTKTKCHTCGHLNKAAAKFCPECGTGLEIV